MRDRPSPNFDDRDPNVRLDYVVLHYTGMKDAGAALARLCDPASKVSAHYVVGEDGAVVRLVDEAKRAWHAGESCWRGVRDMNSASIGIELVNPGHEFGYRPFPASQIAAVKRLLRDIMERNGLTAATALLAHSDIAPARKKDPGELFPWRDLAKDGFGFWPEPAGGAGALLDSDGAREALAAIGYDVSDFGAAVMAFQRRFAPERITGCMDNETALKISLVNA